MIEWIFPLIILMENGAYRSQEAALDKRVMPHRIIICWTDYQVEKDLWRCMVQPENSKTVKFVNLNLGGETPGY